MRSAQSARRSPETKKVVSSVRSSCSKTPTCTKAIHDSAIAANRNSVVTSSEGRAPIARPNKPAMIQPSKGRKRMVWYIRPASPLHQIDVLNSDRSAVAEIDDHDRQSDRRLRGGDSQDQKRIDLPHQIAEMR